jgi:hypothetical protein
MATKNHHLHIEAGADVSAPTRASKPAAETYKSPRLDRGGVVLEPRSTLSGYGRNNASHASSCDVSQSGGTRGGGLSDIDAQLDDPVKAALASGGVDDKSGAGPLADLQRKISLDNVGDAHGMSSNRQRQSGGVEKLAGKSLPATLGNNESEPVRKP